MKWRNLLRASKAADLSLYEIQPIVQNAFTGGSLTAAFLNISAIVCLAVTRRVNAMVKCMRDEDCCCA